MNAPYCTISRPIPIADRERVWVDKFGPDMPRAKLQEWAADWLAERAQLHELLDADRTTMGEQVGARLAATARFVAGERRVVA